MKKEFTFEMKHRMGVPYPNEYDILENGTARLRVHSLADAAFFTNLLNLTTAEQQHEARLALYGKDAAE